MKNVTFEDDDGRSFVGDVVLAEANGTFGTVVCGRNILFFASHRGFVPNGPQHGKIFEKEEEAKKWFNAIKLRK